VSAPPTPRANQSFIPAAFGPRPRPAGRPWRSIDRAVRHGTSRDPRTTNTASWLNKHKLAVVARGRYGTPSLLRILYPNAKYLEKVLDQEAIFLFFPPPPVQKNLLPVDRWDLFTGGPSVRDQTVRETHRPARVTCRNLARTAQHSVACRVLSRGRSSEQRGREQERRWWESARFLV
jgi:hypothetical protein